jgi:beta-lactamase superfamily II metal-dependent hydrolase
MNTNGKYDFGFSVDEIFLDEQSRNKFGVRLIPDYNSLYFPPYHTRVVYVPSEYLSKEFYSAIHNKNEDLPGANEIHFIEIIEQGGYYKIDRKEFLNNIRTTDYQKEVLFLNKDKSPYSEETNNKIENIKVLDKPSKEFGNLYIYCFNVGQGDSFLIIFPNGSVYVIDTNICYDRADRYVDCVKRILSSHNLPNDRIKAIFFTHKHLDHIRGASHLIRNFKIEYFVINLDYSHPIKPVEDLFNIARANIPVWLNCNKEAQIFEGETRIDIRNPDANTSRKDRTPDINDSSICLCIYHGKNQAYLTGDAGHPIINTKYDDMLTNKVFERTHNKNFLKVSHHGSKSGTNDRVLDILNPSHCFISAGHSSKYNHPSPEIMALLKSSLIVEKPVIVSKVIERYIQYKFDGKGISYRCL